MEISEEPVIANSSRLKSVVWNDFDRVKKGDSFVAICRLCKRMLNGSSTSGTSHLRNHLIRCRKKSNHDVTQLLTRGKRKQTPVAITNFSYNQAPVKNEIVTVASTDSKQGLKVGNVNMSSFNFDHRQSQLDLAHMIIMHGYPLDMVEDIGFKDFVRNLQPWFDLVGVNEVVADCMEIYCKEKQKVYEELDKMPGKVSLSVDRWVNNGGTGFLCLTAHYINDSWEIRKKILNFLVIHPFQAEEMLSEVIMTSLKNWDIDRKLFSLTIDNSSTYDKVVFRVRDQLCQHRFLMCEGQLFDVRCAASTIKLLVQDVLEISRELINKVRETIRYIKSSQEIHEKFDEIVQLIGINSQKCLSVDNTHQWNSTYLMLEAALEYKEVFTQLEEHDLDFSMSPSILEWDRLRAITSILKFFYEVSNGFAGSKHANSYFAEICDIHLQLIEWCQKSDDFISSLALTLKSKFDEYWKKCSLIMAIAAILDPRFKMKLVEYYYPQIYGDSSPNCIDIVSNCMKALYSGHAIYSPLAGHGQSSASESSVNVVKDRLVGYDRFLHENSAGQHTKSDLDKYFEEPLFPRSVDFSILNWWKVHEPRYPVLSMMARNILGIPISKAAPESLFDIGDKALNNCWSSLKSDTLQALMCSQDWIRNDLEINDSNVSTTPVYALCYDAN